MFCFGGQFAIRIGAVIIAGGFTSYYGTFLTGWHPKGWNTECMV